MQFQQVQILILLLSFALSLFLLIGAAKYAHWASPMVHAGGDWLPLVFYVGTIPFLSLFYATAHLIMLHFDFLPTASEPGSRSFAKIILAVSCLQLVGWFGQAIVCTACEMVPIMSGNQGRVPTWCPQSKFQDTGKKGLANMLGTLALAKDSIQWIMVGVSAALIECARRQYLMPVPSGYPELEGSGMRQPVELDAFYYKAQGGGLKRNVTVNYESRV